MNVMQGPIAPDVTQALIAKAAAVQEAIRLAKVYNYEVR